MGEVLERGERRKGTEKHKTGEGLRRRTRSRSIKGKSRNDARNRKKSKLYGADIKKKKEEKKKKKCQRTESISGIKKGREGRGKDPRQPEGSF